MPAKFRENLVLNVNSDKHSDKYWYDISRFKNHGTIIGASWRNKLKFDGVDDYVSVPDSDIFNLSSFTLSAWVKYTFNPLAPSIIVRQQKGAINWWSLDIVNAKPRLVIRDDLATDSGVTSPTILDNNTWYHIVGVRDMNNTLKIYVDGVEKKSIADATSQTISVDSDVYAGSFAGTTNFLNGSIDEVMIFNRVLSANEVKELYNLARGEY